MDALNKLPGTQRQAVELMVLRAEPLKLREVAEIQKAPISTVHSRLQAALRKLAAALPDRGRRPAGRGTGPSSSG